MLRYTYDTPHYVKYNLYVSISKGPEKSSLIRARLMQKYNRLSSLVTWC